MYIFPAEPPHPPRINLALQGGGSHGAFTWGVLDALLADRRLSFDGISGASAGAVNAVAVAHGFASHADPAARRQGARDTLRKVWEGVAAMGSLGAMAQGVVRLMLGDWPRASLGNQLLQNAMAPWMSPYQMNPLDINPLRKLLADSIDFEGIARLDSPRVFVSATHVKTGRADLFSGSRLTLQAVMASACLPTLFQAVEIDGEHYWDGGYSGNPALTPLVQHCASRDIVVVQINPLHRAETPHTPQEILDRMNELTFNASLVDQMRSIDFINRLIEEGRLQEGHGYKRLLLHRIDGGRELEQLPAFTKMATDGAMIEHLFKLGHSAARHWLTAHFEALGRRSTINIRHDYVSPASSLD